MNPSTLSGGSPDRSMTPALRTARILGWASFGLAAAFVAAPGRIAQTFGVEGKENLIRAFGAQEIMAGVGALSTEVVPSMWARAGGDVIHMATLAIALRSKDAKTRRNVEVGLAALFGFLVIDGFIARQLTSERSRARGQIPDYGDRSGFPSGLVKSPSATAEAQVGAPELVPA